MEILYAKGNVIEFKNHKYYLRDLVTTEFLEYANSIIDKYYTDCCIVNELYIYYLQNYLALDYFIKSNDIHKIEMENVEDSLKAYLQDIAARRAIVINKGKSILYFPRIRSYSIIIASTFYIVWSQLKVPFIKEKFFAREFALIRQKAAEIKFQKINIRKELEGLNKKDSIYKYIPVSERIGWSLKSLIEGFRLYGDIMKTISDFMGKSSAAFISKFYDKRVVYTCFYEHLLRYLFSENRESTYYTASFLDRISVIEDKVAEEFNIKTVCIPHGMEYGFKMPKGYSTSTFYATSDYSAKWLNSQYNTNKFVFSEEIANKMFKRDGFDAARHKRKVVFFSELEGKDVNDYIVSNLKELLTKDGIPFALRLHPAERKEDYEKFGLDILSDFDDAICGNVCVSRKSTVLIEAVYNNSNSSAILINDYDKLLFNTFPSLHSEKIERAYNIDDLYKWIKKVY